MSGPNTPHFGILVSVQVSSSIKVYSVMHGNAGSCPSAVVSISAPSLSSKTAKIHRGLQKSGLPLVFFFATPLTFLCLAYARGFLLPSRF